MPVSEEHRGFKSYAIGECACNTQGHLAIYNSGYGNCGEVTTPVLRLNNNGGTNPGLDVIRDGLTISAGGLISKSCVSILCGKDLKFTGATGESQITVTDNLADALSIIVAGGADLMVLTTTNCAEQVTITPTLLSIGGVAYTWPCAGGCAGTQLQTTACDVLSWAAAGSLAQYKELHDPLCTKACCVLQELVDTPVYDFTYKQDARMSTGDFSTHYTGVVGEDLPGVMHHEGKIFSEVNAFGYSVLAIKALAARVERLEDHTGLDRPKYPLDECWQGVL